MKKLILALLFTSVGYAQEFGAISLVSGVQMEDKPSVVYGAEVEYSGGGYVRASILATTQNENSIDFIASGGVNIFTDRFRDYKFYIGARVGSTKRKGANAMAGFEAGFDAVISDNTFIGVRGMLDYKSDNKFYAEPNKMEPTVVLRIGFKF